MISTSRRWLRRNRTNFAISFGVLGAAYVAGQYVLSKITETRERMSSDRIAKENLRRRFQQNQEDCTFTVLALLPTAAENIIEALPVETITHELQQKKAERLGKSIGALGGTPSDLSSGPPSVTDDDGRSLASFQSEGYVHASQMAASASGDGAPELQRSQKSKAQLWNELKISSITRSFSLLYTLSLLTLLTRIQLNLLGRRNYLSSVVSLASPSPNESIISLENRDDDSIDPSYGNDFETNRKFLTFSWWLLHRGWRDIMEKVEMAVRETFGPLNPREDISLERLSALTLEVRRKVEGATPEERSARNWLPYLLPTRDEEDFVLRESGMSTSPPNPSPQTEFVPQPSTSPSLRRLLDETSDLIDSPPFSHILTILLDTTFSHLTDQKLCSQAFKISHPSPSATAPAPRIEEILDPKTPEDLAQAKTKFATILAVMTRQAHSIGNGVPNEYVQDMEAVRELEAFAAVVYSSHYEFEGPEIGDEGESEGVGTRKAVEVEEAPESVEAKVLGPDGSRKGVVDMAGSVFESVWGRVVGREDGAAMTG